MSYLGPKSNFLSGRGSAFTKLDPSDPDVILILPGGGVYTFWQALVLISIFKHTTIGNKIKAIIAESGGAINTAVAFAGFAQNGEQGVADKLQAFWSFVAPNAAFGYLLSFLGKDFNDAIAMSARSAGKNFGVHPLVEIISHFAKGFDAPNLPPVYVRVTLASGESVIKRASDFHDIAASAAYDKIFEPVKTRDLGFCKDGIHGRSPGLIEHILNIISNNNTILLCIDPFNQTAVKNLPADLATKISSDLFAQVGAVLEHVLLDDTRPHHAAVTFSHIRPSIQLPPNILYSDPMSMIRMALAGVTDCMNFFSNHHPGFIKSKPTILDFYATNPFIPINSFQQAAYRMLCGQFPLFPACHHPHTNKAAAHPQPALP